VVRLAGKGQRNGLLGLAESFGLKRIGNSICGLEAGSLKWGERSPVFMKLMINKQTIGKCWIVGLAALIAGSFTGCLGRDYESWSLTSASYPSGNDTSPANPVGGQRGFGAFPGGFATSPFGWSSYPRGFTTGPYGFGTYPGGFTTYPNGFTTFPNGFTTYPNGGFPNGFTTGPNGFTTVPNGFFPRNGVTLPGSGGNSTFPE